MYQVKWLSRERVRKLRDYCVAPDVSFSKMKSAKQSLRRPGDEVCEAATLIRGGHLATTLVRQSVERHLYPLR